MKNAIAFTWLLAFFAHATNAQIGVKQLQPFLNGLTLIDTSGPGLKQASGDILLELAPEGLDENETLVLLHNEKGRLSKVSENADLLMGKEMLGISGGNYPSLSGNILSVDYTTGSNSGQSNISMKFERDKDGRYYFKEYTSVELNFGVEDLFSRQRITAAQTGKIDFQEADEPKIIEMAKVKPSPKDIGEPLYQAGQRYAKYVPEGFALAAFAEGDLNLDAYKKDLLLVLYNEETCAIRLLMQQKDGSYQIAQTNNVLIVPNETFNVNNLRAVIKNGYFTIEQRIATDASDFDHRYLTFVYDAKDRNWYLHRFDVEHYAGFDPKPSTNVTHLTKKDFGQIPFQTIDRPPDARR